MDKSKFKQMYSDMIKYSVEEHELIKEDIKYGLKNKLIKNKIENFFKSEMYKDIRKIRIKRVDSGNKKLSREL